MSENIFYEKFVKTFTRMVERGISEPKIIYSSVQFLRGFYTDCTLGKWNVLWDFCFLSKVNVVLMGRFFIMFLTNYVGCFFSTHNLNIIVITGPRSLYIVNIYFIKILE